jgi:hypothetical protein
LLLSDDGNAYDPNSIAIDYGEAFYRNHPCASTRPIYQRGKWISTESDVPLVSVVMPFTCSNLPYIAESILSVQHQTLQQFELVIVSDAFNDESVMKSLTIMTASDRRIHIVFIPERLALAGARTVGFANSRAA